MFFSTMEELPPSGFYVSSGWLISWLLIFACAVKNLVPPHMLTWMCRIFYNKLSYVPIGISALSIIYWVMPSVWACLCSIFCIVPAPLTNFLVFFCIIKYLSVCQYDETIIGNYLNSVREKRKSKYVYDIEFLNEIMMYASEMIKKGQGTINIWLVDWTQVTVLRSCIFQFQKKPSDDYILVYCENKDHSTGFEEFYIDKNCLEHFKKFEKKFDLKKFD